MKASLPVTIRYAVIGSVAALGALIGLNGMSLCCVFMTVMGRWSGVECHIDQFYKRLMYVFLGSVISMTGQLGRLGHLLF